VTNILDNGGGEIERDIFVTPNRLMSDENLQKSESKIQWRDCGIRIGDVVGVSAKPCLPPCGRQMSGRLWGGEYGTALGRKREITFARFGDEDGACAFSDIDHRYHFQVLLKEHKGRDRRFEWFADQVALLERTSQESKSRDSLAEERRSRDSIAEERSRRHSNESDRGEERHRYSNESNRGEGRSYGPVIEGSGDHDTPRKRSSSRWDQGSNSRESSGLGISVVEGDVGGGSGGDGVDPRLRPPVLSRDNSLKSQDRESPITPSSASGAFADKPPRDPRLPPTAAAAAAPTSVDLGAGNGTQDISSEQRSPVESVAKYALAPAKELTWADLSSVTMTPIGPPDYSVFPQAWNGGLAYKQQVFDVSFRHVMGDIQLVMEALGSLKGGQIEVKARIRNEDVESKFTRQLSARDGTFFSFAFSACRIHGHAQGPARSDTISHLCPLADIVTCLVLSSDGSASIEGFDSYLEQCQKCAYVELSDRCHALVMPSGTPLHKALVPGVKHPAVIAWVHDKKRVLPRDMCSITKE
jgi:hypothetical protein